MKTLLRAGALALVCAALAGCGGTPLKLPDPFNLSGTATATGAASWTFTGNPVTDAQQFDPMVAKLKTFTAGDIDNAIADAEAQIPPDIAAVGCWSTVKLALPVLNMPKDTGAAILLQKARDAQSWLPLIIKECNNMIPFTGLLP
jgi:hypothetical protein